MKAFLLLLSGLFVCYVLSPLASSIPITPNGMIVKCAVVGGILLVLSLFGGKS